MKSGVIGIATAAVSALAGARSFRFDDLAIGAAPSGWNCGVTGRGSPKWTIERDPSGGTGNMMLQSGSGTFLWCLKAGTALAGGVVWRRA